MAAAAADPQQQLGWPTPSIDHRSISVGEFVEEEREAEVCQEVGGASVEKEKEAIERLKEKLPSWVVDVPVMVKRHPRLVKADPAVLASRLQKLRDLLPMCDGELAKIVRAQPSLVNHSPEALASTVRQLSSLVPHEVDVAYLLSSRPILLKQSAKTLAANWESLKRHAALVPRWQQELELFSKRRSTALGNLLLYGRKKHTRLERVAALAPALRDRYALSTIFNMKDDAFEDKFQNKTNVMLPLDPKSPPLSSSSSSDLEQPQLLVVNAPQHTKRQRIVRDDQTDDLGVPIVAKRQRGSRLPFCPKCDNPKCHKSHTYAAPCVRQGQVKPVRAKPKFAPGSSNPQKDQNVLISTLLPSSSTQSHSGNLGNQLDETSVSWGQAEANTAIL